ncbi:MAG TPA: saccharopine dehydrogenase C-terminal domain-containing protein [Gemmatimonadaceae bacterium]|jgi:lysine 6-dehydrogenase|nr:saccharopine dehydrogenase C-terminal domain-containing protein [Gemmatimonadaceae bacterium]
MKMLVLGAGLQGSACAYCLLKDTEVTEVRIADLHVDKLPKFLAKAAGADKKLKPLQLDVRDRAAVLAAMKGVDAVMSAIPYYFNFEMAECAVEAGVHFSDLGGNTEIVSRQRTLDAEATKKKISVMPDCGLAPGMVNILAQRGIDQLDTVDAVRIYVGGLPQHPSGPLNYQIVYSLEGVLDYYTTLSWVLRDGKRAQVKALSELEPIDFPAPIGTLEAFHTAGGLSTMAFRYEGKIPTMEYKTLRYPGHARIMEGIRELGLLEQEPIEVNGLRVSPRAVAVAAMTPRLTMPESADLVALRVIVSGTKAGKPKTFQWDLVDRMDPKTGISAMERTTGFSLAITGLTQVRGKVKALGVRTPDEAMPAEPYMAALKEQGVVIKEQSR